MPHRIYRPLSLILLMLTAQQTAVANGNAQRWSQLATPSLSVHGSQSIGNYTSGCIAGAQTLPSNGSGYQVMRLSRNRYYGHDHLIEFIQHLGSFTATNRLGTLLIGDLGQARGGPMISGHRSHQSGLDVDIWFLLSPQADNHILSANERETWNAPTVVDAGGNSVDYRQWSLAHAQILEAAARQPEVDRIFVHPSIKQELCNRRTPDAAVWLRKIRPWWKHDDHFHVRLRCPPNSPNCVSQEPLPAGDGCDGSLAWWFSDEAKTPTASKPQPAPPLPALCEQLLSR